MSERNQSSIKNGWNAIKTGRYGIWLSAAGEILKQSSTIQLAQKVHISLNFQFEPS